jgi:hypothetical protein
MFYVRLAGADFECELKTNGLHLTTNTSDNPQTEAASFDPKVSNRGAEGLSRGLAVILAAAQDVPGRHPGNLLPEHTVRGAQHAWYCTKYRTRGVSGRSQQSASHTITGVE